MADTEPMRLWEGQAPNQQGDGPDDIPTLQMFKPDRPDGSAIVVCPGGGYGNLAPHEADPVARRWNANGVTGFVLRYRHAPKYRHPTPLLDAARAIRTVRARAKEWQLDPNRIGVLGFSAGGHLAATISTKFDEGDPNAPDPVDRVSSRPDVSVLCYPVITMMESEAAHTGSRRNLLGDNARKEMLSLMSPERHVTDRTPPAFLFHTEEDQGVPVENSLLYAAALRNAKVHFAMHIFQQGRHGVGLAENDPVLRAWPDLCAAWLSTHRFGWADKTATSGPS